MRYWFKNSIERNWSIVRFYYTQLVSLSQHRLQDKKKEATFFSLFWKKNFERKKSMATFYFSLLSRCVLTGILSACSSKRTTKATKETKAFLFILFLFFFFSRQFAITAWFFFGRQSEGKNFIRFSHFFFRIDNRCHLTKNHLYRYIVDTNIYLI